MPIPSSDLVTVPREVLEDTLEYFTGSRAPIPLSPFGAISGGYGPMGSIVRKLNSALLRALTQSDVGRTTKEDVQGSIADGQQCNEHQARALSLLPCPFCNCAKIDVYTDDGDSIPARDHEYVAQCWDCSARIAPVVGKQAAINRWNARPSDPLTKTPSADHDAGNLRSLAEPPSPRLTDGDQTGGGK